jgi:Flp pilus assembly protein TadD
MAARPDDAIVTAQDFRADGDTIAALRTLRRAAKRAPKSHELLLALGTELDLQNDHKGAAQILHRALLLKPDDVETLNTLGNAEQACGRLAGALTCYEKAAALMPESPELRINIGDMLRQSGSYEEAKHHLQDALSIAPNNVFAHYHLAIIALQSGAADTALTHLDVCLGERSYYPEALALKAAALRAGKHFAEAAALMDFERFIHIQHLDAPQGYPTIGKFNRKLERYVLDQRLTVDPSTASTRGGRHGEDLLVQARGPAVDLKNMLQRAVSGYIQQLPVEPDHPFLAPSGPNLRVVAQANILDSAGYLLNHVHPLAWISGAYYVRLPPEIEQTDRTGAGWLRFGVLPDSMHVSLPLPTYDVQPEEGMLVLFPAYFYHGTVAFSSATHRMSLGIDVMLH